MTENMEALLAGVIHYIPTLLGIAVGYLWNKARGLSKEREVNKAALRTLLKLSLFTLYTHAVSKGYMPLQTEGLAEEVYKHYHALGGNGQGTKIIEDIRRLPHEKVDVC